MDVFKKIMGIAEAVAVQAVPGAKLADAGVRSVVDAIRKKDEAGVWEGIENAIEGGIEAAESIKGAEIADQQMFRAGVALLHQAETTAKMGEALIAKSLKPAPAPAAA